MNQLQLKRVIIQLNGKLDNKPFRIQDGEIFYLDILVWSQDQHDKMFNPDVHESSFHVCYQVISLNLCLITRDMNQACMNLISAMGYDKDSIDTTLAGIVTAQSQ
jgi:hypothetical protein